MTAGLYSGGRTGAHREPGMLSPGETRMLVAGSDVVFHVAAKVDLNPDRNGSITAVNVEGTRKTSPGRAWPGELAFYRGRGLID